MEVIKNNDLKWFTSHEEALLILEALKNYLENQEKLSQDAKSPDEKVQTLYKTEATKDLISTLQKLYWIDIKKMLHNGSSFEDIAIKIYNEHLIMNLKELGLENNISFPLILSTLKKLSKEGYYK